MREPTQKRLGCWYAPRIRGGRFSLVLNRSGKAFPTEGDQSPTSVTSTSGSSTSAVVKRTFGSL